MRKDMICPYCIRHLDNFSFQCSKCGRSVEPDKLSLLRFKMLGQLPRCSNPGCDHQVLTVRCPYHNDAMELTDPCGQPLPSDIMQYKKNMRFSVLGTTGAGKTNYLTMMINQLKTARSEDNPAGLAIEYVDRMTNTMFRQNLDMILKNKHPVGPTPPGKVIPQIWRIKQNDRTAISLTIFDGAGESQENPDGSSENGAAGPGASEDRVSRYIYGSKQFILLIDPLAIPSLRAHLSKEAIMGSSHETKEEEDGETHNAIDMVNTIANFIRAQTGLNVNAAIKMPTAVVLTKLDLFLDEFGNSTVKQESPHLKAGCFVEADSLAVDLEIRSWLKQNGSSNLEGNDGEEFVKAVERQFRSVRFFGVSSFGRQPSEYKILEAVYPHRVLDPLMWLLAQENIIPTRKPQRR